MQYAGEVHSEGIVPISSQTRCRKNYVCRNATTGEIHTFLQDCCLLAFILFELTRLWEKRMGFECVHLRGVYCKQNARAATQININIRGSRIVKRFLSCSHHRCAIFSYDM